MRFAPFQERSSARYVDSEGGQVGYELEPVEFLGVDGVWHPGQRARFTYVFDGMFTFENSPPAAVYDRCMNPVRVTNHLYAELRVHRPFQQRDHHYVPPWLILGGHNLTLQQGHSIEVGPRSMPFRVAPWDRDQNSVYLVHNLSGTELTLGRLWFQPDEPFPTRDFDDRARDEWTGSGVTLWPCPESAAPSPSRSALGPRGLDGEPPVAVSMAAAIAALEADPTLRAYQDYRTRHPESFLWSWNYTSVKLEWRFVFAARGADDCISVLCALLPPTDRFRCQDSALPLAHRGQRFESRSAASYSAVFDLFRHATGKEPTYVEFRYESNDWEQFVWVPTVEGPLVGVLSWIDGPQGVTLVFPMETADWFAFEGEARTERPPS